MAVVVVGDCNVDIELVLPEGVELELRNPDPRLSGGGSAANTAAALARLGIDVAFVGTVGADSFGEAAVTSLREAGVDVSAVAVARDEPTVAVFVLVRPDADRVIWVWPPRGGAHTALVEARATSAVEGAAWVHVSGIALRGDPAASSILQAMRVARAQGSTVSLDLNLRLENWGWERGFRSVIEEAVACADVVFGGAEDELQPLVGTESLDVALTEISAKSAGGVVVARLGAAGATVTDGTVIEHGGGFDVAIVDPVGAGDAFDAGFIAARMRGADLATALRRANGVAALTIGRPGARDTPTEAELEVFLDC